METSKNRRTYIIGAIAGLALAGAMGAAFMLGSNSGRDTKATVERDSSATAASPASTDGGPINQPQPAVAGQASEQDGDGPSAPAGGDSGEPAPVEPTATPTVAQPTDEDDDDDPTATPTATSTATPHGPDGFAAEPTPTNTPDSCPLCNDLELAIPVDYEPEISNISTSFCYPNLVVFFTLEHADAVWFTYVYDGVTYHSTHIDADTFLGFLSDDVTSLGWGALLIDNIRIHATDDQGNHTVSDEIPMPELEFC